MSEAWIIDHCRTPRGIGKKGKGSLADQHPQHLGATVLGAIAERNKLNTAEVGDVILTGKFKNKRTVVKKIETDDMGQPIINGMKALSFRIEKLMPKSKWSKKSLEEKK